MGAWIVRALLSHSVEEIVYFASGKAVCAFLSRVARRVKKYIYYRKNKNATLNKTGYFFTYFIAHAVVK